MKLAIPIKRILVVDDEVHIREVIQACLEMLGGWEVLAAASGKEGLDKAIVEQPDAIVLDVMMPDMTGLGFLKQLQTTPMIQSIPVILLTIRADLTEPHMLKKLNISGAIDKPFDPTTLHQQIAQALGWC